jgi:hypothetical protein
MLEPHFHVGSFNLQAIMGEPLMLYVHKNTDVAAISF